MSDSTNYTNQTAVNSENLAQSVDMNVGGQAVIEGVMMRSPHIIATAVRLPDGTIEMKMQPFVSFTKRHSIFNIPILRGAINFAEMLFVGLNTLNWSADIQIQYEDKKNGKEPTKRNRLINNLMLGSSVVIAIVIAIGIFFSLPIWIATLMGLSKGAFFFNLVAGAIRVLLFLAYLFGISQMEDIRRIFRYHGAEHMSIFALEASAPLTVESVRNHGRLHPRCGTSFILIVALFSIFFFGIADSLFPLVFGHMQSFLERLATHLSLMPVVAGLSYELLKLSGRFRSNGLVQALIKPGLWLQRITTGDPDDDMLEVAICSLKAALEPVEMRS